MRAPFGIDEFTAAVAGHEAVLDVGCGSGQLTVALARAGHRVTGLDNAAAVLERAGRAAAEAGVEIELVLADMTDPPPFPPASFDALVSRFSLMIPPDPVATLRALAGSLRPGAAVATAVWARRDENPWFCEARAAAADALGPERTTFARIFGRLGTPEELAAAHREAGLADVQARRLHERLRAADAAAHWAWLARESRPFRRLDGLLDDEERGRVVAALGERLAPWQVEGGLDLPRTIIFAEARRP